MKHEHIARLILSAYQYTPGYDLVDAITKALDAAALDERMEWNALLEGAIVRCEDQGLTQGAQVLRAIIEVQKAVPA